MHKTEFAIKFSTVETENNGVPVVIVAAGGSSRMGGINKIFTPVAGIPVIARTMLAFERNSYISEIIVVTKNESMADISRIADSYMINKLTAVVEGGADRLSSVQKGIEAIGCNCKSVLIHDGARPFVSDNLISTIARASHNNDCVVCGIPVKDTLKEIGKKVSTPKRDKFIAVQTPQSLNLEIYKKLLNECADKSIYTDDASVMEQAGYKVNIVEGEETNIKITTPFDLLVAELIVKESE